MAAKDMTTPKKGAVATTKKSPLASNAAEHVAIMEKLASFRSRLAGMQFGGNRDIYAVAGYPAEGQVKFEHYWGLYNRDGIGGRIVDMPAKTTWRTPPEIIEEDMAEEGTEFTKAFDTLAKRIKLWSYLGRVDRLAGIGRYAVLFIGVRGVNDQQLKTPMTRLSKPEDIIYLSVYHEKNAEIMEWETDTGNERFGLPKLYKLKTTNDNTSFKSKNTDLVVHASRCIHVAEDILEDDTFGRPRLERTLNRLFDLEKVAASTGESYWQLVTQILQAKIDKEIEVTEPQIAELDEKLGDLVHDLRRQFYGRGIELSWLNTQTPNVEQVADFYFSLIAGSCGIPKRKLFGSEMGELASSQDEANYIGLINERQEQFAEPAILRQFIDRLIVVGALPKPKKGEYQVNWPTLYEDSDKDKAAANLARAQAAQALTPVGGNPRELTRVTEEGEIELVAREPDAPMDLTEPDTPDNSSEIADLQAEITDAEASGAAPEEIQKLKDKLKALETKPAPPAGGGAPTGGEGGGGAPPSGGGQGG